MFIKNGLILGVSSVFIGLINYAFQILMVNKMQAEEFKLASMILSSYAILGTILTAYLYWGQKTKFYIERKFYDLYLLFIIIPLFFLYIDLNIYLTAFTIIVMLLCTNFTIVNINIKYLNNEKYFKSSISFFISSIVKLSIAIIFILSIEKFNIIIFYYSFLIGSLFSYLFLILNSKKDKVNIQSKSSFWKILVSIFTTNLYLNFDILLVSIYCDSEIVISYAIVSTISKAVIHLMSGFTFLIFKDEYKNITNKEFQKKLLIGVFISFFTCIFLYIIGDFLIDLLYSKGNELAKKLLPIYLLTIIPIFIIQIIEHVIISNNKTIGSYIFIISAIFDFILINSFVNNIKLFILYSLIIKIIGVFIIIFLARKNLNYEKK